MKKSIIFIFFILTTVIYAQVHSFEFENDLLNNHRRSGSIKVSGDYLYAKCRYSLEKYYINDENELEYVSQINCNDQINDFHIIDNNLYLLYDYKFQVMNLDDNSITYEYLFSNDDYYGNGLGSKFVTSENHLIINRYKVIFFDLSLNTMIIPETNIREPKMIVGNLLYTYYDNLQIYDISNYQNPELINDSNFTFPEVYPEYIALTTYLDKVIVFCQDISFATENSIQLLDVSDSQTTIIDSISFCRPLSSLPIVKDNKLIVPSTSSNDDVWVQIFDLSNNEITLENQLSFSNDKSANRNTNITNTATLNGDILYISKERNIFSFDLSADDIQIAQNTFDQDYIKKWTIAFDENFVVYRENNTLIKIDSDSGEETVLYQDALLDEMSCYYKYDNDLIYISCRNQNNSSDLIKLLIISTEDGSIVHEINNYNNLITYVFNDVIYAKENDNTILIGSVENGELVFSDSLEFTDVERVLVQKEINGFILIESVNDGNYTTFVLDPNTNEIIFSCDDNDFQLPDSHRHQLKYFDNEKVIIFLAENRHELRMFSHDNFSNFNETDRIAFNSFFDTLCNDEFILYYSNNGINVVENNGLTFDEPYYFFPSNYIFEEIKFFENRIYLRNYESLNSYTYNQGTSVDKIDSLNNCNLTNYPNPFSLSNSRSSTTNINFNLKENGKVQLDVYNIKGQKIRNLCNSNLTKGNKNFTWDGSNKKGEKVSSGVYFYQLRIDGKTINTKKCLLMK